MVFNKTTTPSGVIPTEEKSAEAKLPEVPVKSKWTTSVLPRPKKGTITDFENFELRILRGEDKK